MSNLFFQAEDFVSSRNLPILKNIEGIIEYTGLEQDAVDHWLFGVDASSLVGKMNLQSLLVQTGATVQPTYQANSVTLGAARGNSLQNGLLDSNPAGFTISGVVKAADTSLIILLGTLGDTTQPTGFGAFSSANKVYATVRTGVGSLDSGAALDMSKPVFISLSVNPNGGITNFVVMQGGVFYEKTATGTQAPSNTKLSLGNSRYVTSAAYDALRNVFYELVIHAKPLSLSEMRKVGERAKVRQAKLNNDF